ncbi:hypothetical protein [Thiococcus pfennigii]|nr:hypothetical protein [Thiococcus pfennigii]
MQDLTPMPDDPNALEPIETAIQNKELMAQLGENILIRLAVSNGIEI